MKLTTAAFSVFIFISRIHRVDAQAAYSLSSFDSTQLTNLSPACSSVYTTGLSNCGPSDFLPTTPCSAGCIASLQDVQTEAEAACAGANIPASSMLSYFTNGQGVKEICTSIKAAASVSTMATSTVASSSSMAASTAMTATSSISSSAPASASTIGAEIQGGETTMALSSGTVIAVAVVVVVVTTILVIVGTVLFKKYYSK